MTKTLTNPVFRNGAAAALAIVGLSLSAHDAEAFTVTRTIDLSTISPVSSPSGTTNSTAGTTLSGSFNVNLPGVAATDFKSYPRSRFVYRGATITFGNFPTTERVRFTSTLTPPSNGFGTVNAHTLTLTSLSVMGAATTPLYTTPKTVTSSPPSANPLTVIVSPPGVPNFVAFTPYTNFESSSAIPNLGGVLKADLSDFLRSTAGRNYRTNFSGAGKVTVRYNYDFIPEPNMAFGVLGIAGLGLFLKRKSSGSDSDISDSDEN